MEIHDLSNIRKMPGEDMKSTWLLAETSSREKVFLKKYWGNTISAKKHNNAIREITSYNFLSFPFMLKCFGGNVNEGYIILEYINDFIDLEPTKQDVEEMANIVFDYFNKTDGSFLPEINPSSMEEKIRILSNEGFLNCPKSIGLYLEIEDEIIRDSNYFCHNDYMLQNIKRRKNGKISVFDFELAKKDHYLSDLATLYIDLFYTPEMQIHLIKYISNKTGFDRIIFDTLVWKRAIDQVFALRMKNKNARPFKTGMKILQKYN